MTSFPKTPRLRTRTRQLPWLSSSSRLTARHPQGLSDYCRRGSPSWLSASSGGPIAACLSLHGRERSHHEDAGPQPLTWHLSGQAQRSDDRSHSWLRRVRGLGRTDCLPGPYFAEGASSRASLGMPATRPSRSTPAESAPGDNWHALSRTGLLRGQPRAGPDESCGNTRPGRESIPPRSLPLQHGGTGLPMSLGICSSRLSPASCQTCFPQHPMLWEGTPLLVDRSWQRSLERIAVRRYQGEMAQQSAGCRTPLGGVENFPRRCVAEYNEAGEYPSAAPSTDCVGVPGVPWILRDSTFIPQCECNAFRPAVRAISRKHTYLQCSVETLAWH